MSDGPSISDILSDISENNVSDIESFLAINYDLTTEKSKAIKAIVDLDAKVKQLNISEIISDVASLLVSDYTPAFYINKDFGDFISKRLIHNNDKSMVFVGAPRSNSYEHDVAIKIISPTHQYIAGQEHLSMQAQYMANIQDANIVEINSAGTTEDGIHYLVMEYLPGMNITEHCINNQLHLKQRLKLFIKICSGIAKMHSKLIIHSDIKPANIIMDINDNPKIIDFDLSQSNSVTLHQKFDYKNLKGYTSTYAAPEQLLDTPEITIQTDVFGLGGVLFEILVGYPYSKKTKTTADCIKDSHGKAKRIKEIAFIIDKALAMKYSNRHASVVELINDVSDIIEGVNVSGSYKKHSPLVYRIRHFILRHKVLLATAIGICSTIAFSVNEIVEERDNVKEALQLLMKSNDPRELSTQIQFEKLALESYNKNAIDRVEYYSELMGWGETYYGRGLAEKAAKFFMKAQTLFDDPMSSQRIAATSRLLQAYYSLGLSHLYKTLVDPYLDVIQKGRISDPYLIDLLMVMAEIESRYKGSDYFGHMEYSANQLLSKVIIDDVKDKPLSNKLEISYLMRKGESVYYELPHDHVSTRSYISDATYNTEVKPALVRSKELFESALEIIRNEDIATHQEPKIYIWIAHLYSELGDYTSAESYRVLSLNKTISIFGEYHPRVTSVHLKSFAIHRYLNPARAAEFAQLAFDSYKNRSLKDHDQQVITWVYLIIAHFNNGDSKKGLQEFHNFKSFYGDFTEETKFIASFMSTAGFHVSSFAYLESPEIEEIIEFTAKLELKLVELGADNIDNLWVELVSARTSEAKSSKYIDNYGVYLENASEIDNDTKVTEYLFLLSGCYKLVDCDLAFYINKVEKYMSWSSIDKKMSVEKLTVYLQLAFYYVKLGNNEIATKYLRDVEPIIENQRFDKSFHITYFYRLKAQIAYLNRDTALGEHYKGLAIPGAIYNFGPNSDFTENLISLQ